MSLLSTSSCKLYYDDDMRHKFCGYDRRGVNHKRLHPIQYFVFFVVTIVVHNKIKCSVKDCLNSTKGHSSMSNVQENKTINEAIKC